MSETRRRYRVEARRDGKWWVIRVPEIRGVHSQARRLGDVEYMARDAIALMLEVPADSFDVEVVPTLGHTVEAEVQRARELRAEAERSQRQASEAQRQAVERLVREHGLTIRDASRLLGLSYQRVAQILPSSRSAGRPTRRRTRV